MRIAPLLCVALAAACGERTRGPGDDAGRFPPLGPLAGAAGKGSFRFGVSTAATQIEDMNPASDWYLWTRPAAEGGLGRGKAFVGEASGGYTRALEDVALLRELGVDSYRFSMEWSRIEPRRDQIQEDALAHYGRFLDALAAAGIKPMVTVHHFSNPVWIHDPRQAECGAGVSDDNLCGLGHPEGGRLVVEEMTEHARLLAQRFGDRVDEWGTLNEPVNYLLTAYIIGLFPPGRFTLTDLRGKAVPVFRDFLAAHAAMYRAIKEADTIDADGDGVAATVGIAHAAQEFVPARDGKPSDHPEDLAAVQRLEWFYTYMFPQALVDGALDSDLDGTLDEPHPEWKDTLDWLGVQYYFRTGVTGKTTIIPVVDASFCYDVYDFGSCLPPGDPTWFVPTMHYEFHAAGLYNVLAGISRRWPGLPLVVTESGLATEVGRRRAEHVVRSLEQIERARADGMDVRGYYHWSLYDNFEWAEGFGPRFGLYRVDYATFARTATEGATVLAEIARQRRLTAEQRATYGGAGPMTPEPSPPDAGTP